MSDAVRDRLLDAHRPALERALSCADAVAARWDGETTADREQVVEPYHAALRRAGAVEPLVAALEEASSHAGYELAARPVPDAPYVAVTSRGVVLRGPLWEGRLVVTLVAFEVDPYRRGPPLPAALEVERRGADRDR